jgi:cob(I)alamin adenosyltransferase
MKKGLLLVHTGNGKGKTTAALGLAMRALGHGLKVCIIQFIKGTWKYGELFSAKRFKDLLDVRVMGNGFTWTSKDRDRDKAVAREAWAYATQQMNSGKYALVILDELTYLMTFGFIRQAEVVEALSARRDDLHVVVTGRNAPQALIDAADLVTDMIEMKHPYKKGIKAQKGIEF